MRNLLTYTLTLALVLAQPLAALAGPAMGPSIGMGPASATAPGYVTTGTQTFGGTKNITLGTVNISGLVLSAPLPVASGGTGATSLLAAGIPTLSAANAFTAANTIGGSGLTNALHIFRDATAGASTNLVQIKVGNSSSNQGDTFLRYTNAAATAAPAALWGFAPRNNADSSNFTGGTIVMAKTAGADTGNMTLTAEAGASDTKIVLNENFTIDLRGSVDAENGIQVAGGTIITKVLSAAATLDFGSTAAGAVSDLTITVTGAAVGDTVAIGVPNGSVPASGTFMGWVSTTNTVTIRYANNDLTTARDPASGTFRAAVTQF